MSSSEHRSKSDTRSLSLSRLFPNYDVVYGHLEDWPGTAGAECWGNPVAAIKHSLYIPFYLIIIVMTGTVADWPTVTDVVEQVRHFVSPVQRGRMSIDRLIRIFAFFFLLWFDHIILPNVLLLVRKMLMMPFGYECSCSIEDTRTKRDKEAETES